MKRNIWIAVCMATMLAGTALADGGADIYKAKCALCHGPDGLAGTPAGKALKAVSFKDPAVVKAKDADLIAAVTNGKNKMPAFNGKLSPADIKAAVGYIRTLAK